MWRVLLFIAIVGAALTKYVAVATLLLALWLVLSIIFDEE